MNRQLLVFDSHPVQYRVPIWKAMEASCHDSVHVVYASDCSVKGHSDEGFDRTIAWDEPMLEGYGHTILNCERGTPLSSWSSLTGAGVGEVLDRLQPSHVLLTGLNYRYDALALLGSRKRQIPVWLRCETQDLATKRSFWKSCVRSSVYRSIYPLFKRFFYIGELSRQHYQHHGVPDAKLREARYGTVDRFTALSEAEKSQYRSEARLSAAIDPNDFVIGFSGKFIAKKNPDLLFAMLRHLPEALRKRVVLYFLGSGEMETKLRALANEAEMQLGVRTWFAGFANQSQIAAHYLAMDMLVLPSRRMGETWGLVANEAMQAGCAVAVSDAVGCSADFKSWERFRVFPSENEADLARSVVELAAYERNYVWASQALDRYSIEATANSFLAELNGVS